MNYSIDLSALGVKQNDLNAQSTSVKNICEDYDNGYIKGLSSSEISGIVSKLNNSFSRLKNGYSNSCSWLSRYISELNSVENELSGFSENYKGEFIDIFGRRVIPLLQSATNFDPALLGNLSYGSFNTYTFTGSNGVKVDYYLYLPDYGKEVTDLPVMIYMHGGSAHGTGISGWTSMGLTNKILKQEVTPPGIVICPYIRNFEGDNIGMVIKELTDHVVNTYNADPNKITVSGHSYGAITAYRMINQYPDYFAAAVPISGWDKVTDSFGNVKVWAFHGSNDEGSGQCSYSGALNQLNKINSMGGTALMHTFQGAGHGWVQNYTFEQEYTSPDGEEETVLEWASHQDRRKV